MKRIIKVEINNSNTKVNIPSKIRDMMRIKKGTELELEFIEELDTIIIKKVKK